MYKFTDHEEAIKESYDA